MWQFSFPIATADAAALGARGGEAMREEALRLCAGWMAPVEELLSATSADDVTGYPVFETQLGDDGQLRDGRAALIGDALHAMAPFKAQGANQALLDAVALARALYDSAAGDAAADAAEAAAGAADASARVRRRRSRRPLAEALASYEAEATARAAVKVAASRRASQLLHSPAALAPADGHETRAFAAARAAEAEAQLLATR